MKRLDATQKKLATWIAICLIFVVYTAVIFLLVIPSETQKTEERVRSEIDVDSMEKVKVVMAVKTLGNMVDLSQHKDVFKVIEYPKSWAPSDAISNIEDLNGLYTTIVVPQNQILTKSMTYAPEDGLKPGSRFVEINVSSIVADTVEVGNYIDVLVRRNDGSTPTVLSKKRVVKIVSPYLERITDDKGVVTLVDNSNPADRPPKDFKVVLILDKSEEALVEKASKAGQLYVNKYVNPDQPASPVTYFD